MPKFRKKPVVVEAHQYEGGPSIPAILLWMGTHHQRDRTGEYREGRLFIRTLEGEVEAMPGDWIVRGVQGEFYPCKPETFAQTYESVPTALEGADYANWAAE